MSTSSAARGSPAASTARFRRGRLIDGAGAAARAPRGRRALRPGQGAGRHRPLPDDRPRGAGPRGPRVRLLPHGHRQPPGRPARLRRRAARRTRGSTSTRRRRATPPSSARLAAFGDDSSNYLWKLYAAREIMRLYREDPEELARLEALQTAKNSAEEVLHPPESTPRFGTPAAAARRLGRRRDPRRSPDDPVRTGLARDPRMGELAPRIGAVPRALPRAAPEALAMALYIGAQTREYAGGEGPLLGHLDRARRGVPAPARARATARRRATTRCTRPAGRSTSRASTAPSRQALAFQFVLDRLQVLERDRLGARARRDPRHGGATTRRRCCRCSSVSRTLG